MHISNKILAGFMSFAIASLIGPSPASAATKLFICKNTTSGAISIDRKCRKTETKISNSSALKGDTGAQGTSGLSEVFSGSRTEDVVLGSANVLVGRLTVPTAGKYMVIAKVSLEQTSTAVATTAICELEVDGVKDQILTKLGNSGVAGVPHRDSVALQLVRTTTAASSATLSCRVGNSTTGVASNTQITAVQVNNITEGALGTS